MAAYTIQKYTDGIPPVWAPELQQFIKQEYSLNVRFNSIVLLALSISSVSHSNQNCAIQYGFKVTMTQWNWMKRRFSLTMTTSL